MKIYVCVKHVADTAAKITIIGNNQIDEKVTFIINPYDENAIEAAAGLKKQIADAEIIAVTLGKEAAESTLQSALAMGADRGILIRSDHSPDSMVTARALKAAIEQDGEPDIIFSGNEAIDSEGFQTMFRLGAALKVPVASNVIAFKMEDRFVTVECKMDAGNIGVLRMPLPCIASDMPMPRLTNGLLPGVPADPSVSEACQASQSVASRTRSQHSASPLVLMTRS